jgi:radical SAM protein (TIGR01212 family)
MYERTLRWVNRGHGLSDYIDAVKRAKSRGLRVCTHLILGFPGETHQEILATTALLNQLGVDGVKLHNLHVIKNTQLEKLYHLGQVPLFSRDEYIALIIDFLERLDPNIVVHRLSGETYRAITVAPAWSIDKIGVHNAIYHAMDSRDSWQGRLFHVEKAQDARQTNFDCRQGAGF